nr:uncharacterized protein LOC109189671 [Ipomoea batatas]
MKMKKNDRGWFSTEFRYKRLPTFCFLCGLIGHGEKLCVKSLEGEVQQQERPFGPALRSGNRRNIPTMGEKWIAPEITADRKLWRTSGAGKSAESGGVKMANRQGNGKSVPHSPLKKDDPKACGKHTMGNHVPDKPSNGRDSAHASGKSKETMLNEMELGQPSAINLGQNTPNLLSKAKRPRVYEENWDDSQEECNTSLDDLFMLKEDGMSKGER